MTQQVDRFDRRFGVLSFRSVQSHAISDVFKRVPIESIRPVRQGMLRRCECTALWRRHGLGVKDVELSRLTARHAQGS
jgi:hypothetical protein